MNFSELLRKTRSYRSFDPKSDIPLETLRTFVDNTRLTPSTRNAQALKYKIYEARRGQDELLPLLRFGGALPGRHFPPEGHEPAAYIVICLDETIGSSPLFFKDVGIAAETILLSATEAGFGGCPLGAFDPDAVKDVLHLPAHVTPSLVLALGKPDEKVELCDLPESGSVAYFRDDENVHHVPKRALDDILL